MQASRILLVEDDFTISLDLRESLEAAGFAVEPVYCAGAAFQALDYGPAPLALISDIDLGRGPDGFDVARRARANYPGLPVVFISGTHAACHATEGVADSAFLDKPLRPQRMIETLRGLMTSPSAPERRRRPIGASRQAWAPVRPPRARFVACRSARA